MSNPTTTSSLNMEQLKRKVCLAFPIESEPRLSVQNRELEGKIEYKSVINLLGCTVENMNWYSKKESAIDECVELSDQFSDSIQKMLMFKVKLSQNRKLTDKRESLKVEEATKRFKLENAARKNNYKDGESRRQQTKDENQKKAIRRESNNSNSNGRSSKSKKQTKSSPSLPTFVENINETKNNIVYNVTSVIENPGEFIEMYCRGKSIPFPEYLLEKSNGVYLCRATFLNERFESRYAFDMDAAKRDASNLIISYIKYKVNCDNDTEFKNALKSFLTNENEIMAEKKNIQSEHKESKEGLVEEVKIPNVDKEQLEIQEIVDSFGNNILKDGFDFMSI
uniref:Uncharacterized protein n=1 Tax=Nosema pernyi TaxID=1112939 RepID=X5ELY5_9MICR|nr:hypothetical protein NP_c08 [Nosema pernyi]